MTRQGHQRGVTLIETLLALTILAFAMTVLFRIAGENLQSLSQVEQRAEAMAVAEAVLALPIAVETLPSAGTGREGSYRWERDVTIREVEIEGSNRAAELADVAVTVSWGDLGQSLTLKRLVAVAEAGG